MPSSEDIANAEATVREKAVQILVNRMEADKRQVVKVAEELVRKMDHEELERLTGIKRGGPYSAW